MGIKFKRGAQFEVDILEVLGIEEPVIVPVRADQKLCSFCGIPVSFIEMTEGTGPLRFRRELELIDDIHDPPTFYTRVKVNSSKLVACPKCVDRIPATIDKGGNLTNHIKFTSLE